MSVPAAMAVALLEAAVAAVLAAEASGGVPQLQPRPPRPQPLNPTYGRCCDGIRTTVGPSPAELTLLAYRGIQHGLWFPCRLEIREGFYSCFVFVYLDLNKLL